MKNVLRRTLSVLCALALVVSCLSVSMFAFAATNLATGSQVFIDAVHAQNGQAPSTVIDGSYTTRWQSGTDVSGANSYFGIAWSAAQTFNTIKVYWENSYPNDSTEIYIAESPASLTTIDQTRWPSETVYTDNGTSWTKLTPTYARVDGTGDVAKIDTWTLDSSVTAYAVKVVSVGAGNGSNNNISPFEIEVYNIVGTPADVTKIESAVAYANTAYPSNSYGFTTESWNDLQSAIATANNAVTSYGNQTLESLSVTQAEIDAYAGIVYNAMANLTRTAAPSGNVLLGSPMFFNKNETAYSGNINPTAITDGNYRDNGYCWQPVQDNQASLKAFIKLANAADINEVVFATERNGFSGTGISVYYTTDDLSGVTGYDDFSAAGITWTKAGRYGPENGGTRYGNTTDDYYKVLVDLPGRSESMVNAITFDTVSGVTGLMITESYGQYKIFEVEAYNNTASGNSFTGQQAFVSDSEALVLTNIAQQAVDGYKIRVTGTVTRTDKTSGAEQELVLNEIADSAYGSVSFTVSGTETTYTSASFTGGHLGDYVTGVHFTGLDTLSYDYDFTGVTFSLEAV